MKKINILLILGIILYPLIWVPFGIDLTDSGYVMFYYKQIFSNPEAISSDSARILSSIMGGLWIKIFPFMEYTSCKLGNALIVIFINFLLYKILKNIFKNKTALLFSLFISTICITRPFTQFLNYSSLTVLFFVLGIYYLFSGIINKSKTKIFISSVILSLNVFIRLPNILGIFFVFIFWFWNFINIQAGNYPDKETVKKELTTSLKFSAIFLSGYLLTALIFIFGMKLTGVLDLYLEGFKAIFFYAKTGTTHSISFLLNLYVNSYFKAISISLNFIGIFWSFYEITKLRFCRKNRFRFYFLSSLILFFLYINTFEMTYPLYDKTSYFDLVLSPFILLFINGFWYTLANFLPIGIFLFIPVYVLFDKKSEAKLRLISFLGLLVSVLSFAGSDGYFYNIPGYWFIAVISFYIILLPENIKKLSLNAQHKLKKVGLLFIIFLSIFSIMTKECCYYDSSNKISLNTTIDNNMFRGSYTAKERASVLENFIKTYPAYIKKDDTLLAWPSVPLIHYITNTRTALKTPWPATMDYRIFKKNLEITEKNKKYPVILISKYITTHRKWPDSPENKNINEKNCNIYTDCNDINYCEERKMIYDFIKRNNYLVTWEDKVFVIYKK